MGKILVTGATGGLGRILTEMLVRQGHDVLATGRNPHIGEKLSGIGSRFLAADLAADDLCPLTDGIGTVFHLAALSSPWGRREEFERANVTATSRLIEASIASGVSRFVFASTPSLYARPGDQIGLTENSALPAYFANEYARTKFDAERLVLGAAKPGFATVALRPRAILGPYDTALLPRLLKAARAGVLPLPGGGRALIEPTDARDAASAFLAAAENSPAISGRALNISGGTAIEVRALAEYVFEALGKSVRIIAIPRRLAMATGSLMESAAARLPGRPEPPLTAYSAAILGWSQTFDLAAARSALRWEPQYSPLASVRWALDKHGDA